jgi:acetyltransferase-like isoleucine patch superfamily enzyme
VGQNVLIDVSVIVTNPENVTMGNNSYIDTYVKIEGGTNGYVEIGDYCHIAPLTVIQGEGGLKIKNYIGIAAGCRIYSGSNYYKDPTGKKNVLSMSASAPKEMQHIIRKEIIIDNFAFIGMNSVILPGVRIGERAVIGACSCVMHNIPPKTVAVGCPAKVIKEIE